MQNCPICYEEHDAAPLFFKCVVCEEGKCCFKCYDKMTRASTRVCRASKCPVCQTDISSVLNGLHMFGFIKFQFGVHEKNAKLLSIVNGGSPLIAYLKEHSASEHPHEKCEVQPDEYFDILHTEFPECPFDISLGHETLRTLDDPFCEDDPAMIIIRDTRVLRDTFGFYETVKHDEEVADCELEIYKHHDDCPITLRQVIIQMSTSSHYENGYVIQDDHRFLEQFDIEEEIGEYPVFSPSFGS
jgi:hypothetical protein